MPLLLGQLIHTSFPGVGFQTLASEQVPEEIQQAFVQEIVQRYWDAYHPPARYYRAAYLLQVSPEHWLFGWLYNDGCDDLDRNHVPYFLCYHLASPLTPTQLSTVFRCLERGPVARSERQQVPQALGNLLVPESCEYLAASPGVLIPTEVQESCQLQLTQGTCLQLFIPMDRHSDRQPRMDAIAPPRLTDTEDAGTVGLVADPHPGPQSWDAPGKKIALLIGVSECGPGFNPLPGVLQDVASLQRVLEQADIGGFTIIHTLLNPDPQRMAEAIEELFSDRMPEDLVLLYFSGHAIHDSQGQVLLTTGFTRRSAQKKIVRSTLVPLSFLHEVMHECASEQQIVILDCCFSKASPKGASTANGAIDLKPLADSRRLLLTATTSIHPGVQKGPEGSSYTFYLVEGLATGAADLDGDGVIQVQEWHEYSQRKVQTATPAIVPRLYPLNHRSPLPIAQATLHEPKLQYRQAVEHYAQAGEISLVNRIILEALQARLNLADETASAIAESVFKPHRDYRAKLQDYAQSFVEAVQQEFPLSDRTYKRCKRLQQTLGLTEEDVQPLEAQVTRQVALLHPQAPEAVVEAASEQQRPPLQGFAPLPDLKLWQHLLHLWPGRREALATPDPAAPGDRSLRSRRIGRWLGGGTLLLLLLVGVTTGWQRWQDLRQVEAIAAQARDRNFEACLSQGDKIRRGSSQDAAAQAWLRQCRAGWFWQSARPQVLENATGTYWSVAFSPDGQRLAGGSDDGSISIWNQSNGQLVQTLAGHQDRVWSVAFSPDGRTLASSSGDTTIKLWNLSNNKLVRTLPGHDDTVWTIAFNPRNQTLISGGGDGRINLWNLQNGTCIRSLGGDLGTVRAIALSPDGQTLVGGSQSGLIKVWQLHSGKLVRTLTGHSDRIIALAITPDGKHLVSGSSDRSLRIWELGSGKMTHKFTDPQGWFNAVALSPDGQLLVSGTGKLLQIRQFATGELVRQFGPIPEDITAVALDQRGRLLAYSTQKQGVKGFSR